MPSGATEVPSAEPQQERRADILVRSNVGRIAGYSRLQNRAEFGRFCGQECPRADAGRGVPAAC